MGWLAFTYWGFLIGALSAAIPVYLHMRYRRRAPRIDFSTVRFLLLSVRKTARRRRLHEMLLLALRAGALFLLALGLAGPVLGTGGLLGKGDTALALVVDNSYSMAVETEGRSRYARAKEFALDAARRLTPSSKAILLFTNRPPHAPEGTVEGIASTDKARIVAEIEASEVSAASGSIGEAIARASEILRASSAPNREIHVLTDRQKSAWEDFDPEAVGFPVVALDCGSTGHRNVAVASAEVRSKGLAAGIPLNIQAKLVNFADRDEPNVSVSLYVEKVRRAQKVVDLAKGASAAVSFQEAFDTPGVRTGWVQIDLDDDLEYDNKRFFAVDVPDRIRVLAVQDAEGGAPLLDDLFYLVPALDPAEAGGSGARSVISPTRLLRDALPRTPLDRYAAVMLVNCAELTPEERAALMGYVLRGGCVVFFMGDRVNAEAYRAYATGDGPDGHGLMPAVLGGALGRADERDAPAKLGRIDDSHPIMAPFRGLPKAATDSVHVYRYYRLDTPQGSGARPLAWLESDHPFLVYRRVGAGHTFAFCATANTAWTNLPVRVLFLPLLHQIVYYAAGQREESAALLAGAPMTFSPTEKGERPEVEVVDPLGRRTRLVNEQGQDNRGPARFGGTHQRGVYRWRRLSGEREGAFVVNANSQESDLAALTEDELRRRFGARPLYFARSPDEAARVAERLRTGVQIWNLVLFAVVAIAVAECFLANRSEGGAPARAETPVAGAAQRG